VAVPSITFAQAIEEYCKAKARKKFRTRSIRTAFENAVEEARIDSLHFHDLRHHFASWFVMRGGTLPALQKLLGHADLKMTLRYAHLAPEYLRDEVTKTERTNGNGNGSCSHDGLDGGSSLNCCCFWCRSGDSNPDTLAGTRP
jgi:Phage integrase family